MRTIYEEQSIDIIEQAAEDHGEGLHALISFGNESALLSRIIKLAGVPVEYVTIDSGFRMPGTDSFQTRLSNMDGFEPHIYGPAEEDVRTIKAVELWETDLDRYHEITRYEPLRRAIGERGITGLLSGVRYGQTAHRATMDVIGPGVAGETRIHPLLHWPEEQAELYFDRHGLLRHPQYYQGYGSVGDWTTTKRGEGRQGRGLHNGECGLHVNEEGRLVRSAAGLGTA
ncbi:MAG TPA: phosphoadenosine phosphosulfate reductase family protein [Candidatus Saccharimonadales bacterium]|nr:phosphoadenosine phosphosulfate reductase family protein [Candidatus Saccharimonadales bacterium]